jgi:hypothetical protein
MSRTTEFLHPIPWSDPSFSLEPYNLIFLPGGHEKGVQQLIDSPIMHKHLAAYFPATLKPSTKTVAAVCHGVMVLSETEGKDGKSVIHECDTTALPARFEQAAFWATRLFLGDYYKTYGACSDDVEAAVSCSLFWEASADNCRCGRSWTIRRSSLRIVWGWARRFKSLILEG